MKVKKKDNVFVWPVVWVLARTKDNITTTTTTKKWKWKAWGICVYYYYYYHYYYLPGIFKSRIAASNYVKLVIGELQSLVNPNCDRQRALFGALEKRKYIFTRKCSNLIYSFVFWFFLQEKRFLFKKKVNVSSKIR